MRVRSWSWKPDREESRRVRYQAPLERLMAPAAPKPSKAVYSLDPELNVYSWPCRYFLSFGRKVVLKFPGDRKAEATVWKRCCFLDICRVWVMETVQLCWHHADCCSKAIQGVGCFPHRRLPDRGTTEASGCWLRKILLSEGERASDFKLPKWLFPKSTPLPKNEYMSIKKSWKMSNSSWDTSLQYSDNTVSWHLCVLPFLLSWLEADS